MSDGAYCQRWHLPVAGGSRALASALAVGFLSLLVGLLFLKISPERIVDGTDSPQYDLLARNLAADRGFSFSAGPPFEPTTYREPLYPTLVAAVYRLSGASADAVGVVQVVLLAATSVLVVVLGARVVGLLPGVLGGLLFGATPEAAHYAGWLLTEVPFTLLLMASLLFAVEARQAGRGLDFLLAGVALGLGILTRAVAQSLVPFVAVGSALLVDGRRRWPAVARNAALVLAGTLLVVGPWVLRNVDTSGRPTITARFGTNLLRRAPRAAEPVAAYRDWIVASAWIMANPLSELLVPLRTFQWGPRPEDNLIWDFHVNESVRYVNRYDPVCRAAADWEGCATEIGVAFIRAYPVQYVAQAAFELVKVQFAPLPGFQALVHNATVWLAWIGALTLIVRRRLTRDQGLLLLVVGAYLASSVVLDTQVRYLVPVLPLYGLFAGWTVSRIGLWAAARAGVWPRVRGRVVSGAPSSKRQIRLLPPRERTPVAALPVRDRS